MIAYWPWWAGALALGGITIGFAVLIGRPLGVSGSWAKVVGWREERKLAKEAAQFAADREGAKDAFLEATLAEFGHFDVSDTTGVPALGTDSNAKTRAPTAPWAAHLIFLGCTFVGALLTTVFTSDFHLHFELSQVHTRFSGGEWQSWLTLLIGGMMVGFGTQMAGGCTSGHGLSGCSRLTTASLFATATFFASAVAVSFFVEVLAR